MRCVRCRAIPTQAEGPYRAAPPGPAEKEAHGVPLDRLLDPVTSAELHACPQCGGAYLAHGALAAIEVAARESGRERDAASDQFRRAFARPRVFGQEEVEKIALDCPECNGPMIEREWGFTSLVFVDVCLECRGTWLDEGELADLRRYYGSRG